MTLRVLELWSHTESHVFDAYINKIFELMFILLCYQILFTYKVLVCLLRKKKTRLDFLFQNRMNIG